MGARWSNRGSQDTAGASGSASHGARGVGKSRKATTREAGTATLFNGEVSPFSLVKSCFSGPLQGPLSALRPSLEPRLPVSSAHLPSQLHDLLVAK